MMTVPPLKLVFRLEPKSYLLLMVSVPAAVPMELAAFNDKVPVLPTPPMTTSPEPMAVTLAALEFKIRFCSVTVEVSVAPNVTL